MASDAEVMAAAEEFRDTVLNSRHELAETVEGSEQVNAVLSAFDRTIGVAIDAQRRREEEREKPVTEASMRSRGFVDYEGESGLIFIYVDGDNMFRLIFRIDNSTFHMECDDNVKPYPAMELAHVKTEGDIDDLLTGLGIAKGGA